jgi:hypothetical protein
MRIETTIRALATAYGVALEEYQIDLSMKDVRVTLWRGEDGWHISSEEHVLELTDEAWAPQSDERAEWLLRELQG